MCVRGQRVFFSFSSYHHAKNTWEMRRKFFFFFCLCETKIKCLLLFVVFCRIVSQQMMFIVTKTTLKTSTTTTTKSDNEFLFLIRISNTCWVFRHFFVYNIINNFSSFNIWREEGSQHFVWRRRGRRFQLIVVVFLFWFFSANIIVWGCLTGWFIVVAADMLM